MNTAPSTATQDSSPVLDVANQLGHLALSRGFHGYSSDGFPSFKPNYLSFVRFRGSVSKSRRRLAAAASLRWSARNGAASAIRKIVSEFNKAIRLHCDRVPIGFASVGTCPGEGNGRDDGYGVLEDEGCMPSSAVGGANPKRVLILMSDTGGGHRASAEAIKAAFHEEYGDEYQVSVLESQLISL